MTKSDIIKENYKELRNQIVIFRENYCGFQEILYSPYCHISVLLSFACFGMWTQPGWWEKPISIFPDLLGFTLGGYSILLAFGDKNFLYKISGDNPGRNNTSGEVSSNTQNKNKQKHTKSPFLTISTSFFFFIFLQILALMYAIIYESLYNGYFNWFDYPFSFFGVFILWYALLSGLSAAIHIFSLTRWYDQNVTIEKEKQNDQ